MSSAPRPAKEGAAEPSPAAPGKSSSSAGRPAVFLDRDGTLNVDTHYLPGPEKVELHQGVREGLRLLRERGLLLVVVTNQSGISRGLYTREAVEAIHARIQELLAQGGARVDAFYYCPHAPQEGCACRKPGTELFERAARELSIDLARSAIIGDRWLDVEAGKKLGLTTVYVAEPAFWDHYPEEHRRANAEATMVAPDFLEGCRRLLARG